jgi:hypothetical protein
MLVSTFDQAKAPLAVKAVKPFAAGVVTLILPGLFTDEAGEFGPKGGTYTDCVFSLQPDGTDGWRPPGANGSYERCRVSSSLATFNPAGAYFTRFYVLVEGL